MRCQHFCRYVIIDNVTLFYFIRNYNLRGSEQCFCHWLFFPFIYKIFSNNSRE
jgi:hypothetical protein